MLPSGVVVPEPETLSTIWVDIDVGRVGEGANALQAVSKIKAGIVNNVMGTAIQLCAFV